MAESAGNVPIFAVVRDSWMFLVGNWRVFLPAALAMAIISQIGRAATILMGGGGAATLDLAAAAPLMVAGLMFTGAVMRKAVRGEFTPPIGLALGRDELQLLGVAASAILIAIPVLLLPSMVLSATLLQSVASTPEAVDALAADPEALMAALAQALGPGGIALLTASMLVVVSIMVGLVGLANAATIGERRIMIFQAWSWLRANVLRVIAVMLLTVAPVLVLNVFVAELLASAFLSVTGGSLTLLPYLLMHTTISFVSALLGIPAQAMGAILYKGLRPPDFVAK